MGLPCNPPPWGVLTALESRKILWRALARHIGTPTFGGPLATASRPRLHRRRARRLSGRFDAKTGAELWTGRLPSAGIATPTSYLWQGSTICRDRRRRPWRSRGAGRRHAGRLRPATPRRARPFALVRLARPAGRALQVHAGMAGAVAVAVAALWLRRRRRRHRLSRSAVRLTTSHCAGRVLSSRPWPLSIAPPRTDGHGRASSGQVRFGR
jgi:hypothetical protein